MATKRLTERVSAPFAGATVDREAGTIAGVLICGTRSLNGRDYPASVFRRDFAKYEGRPVNCDHGREATVSRRCGWFENVTCGPDGRPRGTLHLLKSHPVYEPVMEAAERNPKLFGFSHVALCRTKPGTGGREVVEAIDEVESIDLVAEPATTKGLFEGKTVPLTVAQLAAALVRHPRIPMRAVRPLKWLAEDDTGDAPVSAPAPAPDADPGTALDSAFLDAAMAEMKECMAAKGDPEQLKKCLGKLKKMLQAHAEIVADDGDDDSDDQDADADPDTDASDDGSTGGDDFGSKESKRAGGRFVDDLGLFASTTWDRRRAVSEAAPVRPTSAGRGRIAPAVSGRAEEGKPPAEGKGFAEWIRE